jgi:CRISPR system Cascade subunit CasE
MADLHLVRLRFDVPRLFQLAERRRLRQPDVDLGYLVHCQLGELFGDQAPQPFCLPRDLHAPSPSGAPVSSGRTLEVLGYSNVPDEDLRRHVQRSASPEHWKALVDGQIDSKPMPSDWRVGEQVGFELLGCPIVRTHRELPGRKKTPSAHRSLEMDAYLARKLAAPAGTVLEPVEIYREWFLAQVERLGGARVVALDVASYRQEKLTRRTHDPERRVHRLERPRVVFRGRLEVVDPSRFIALLGRGVGRHRAFGFGMLLVRAG